MQDMTGISLGATGIQIGLFIVAIVCMSISLNGIGAIKMKKANAIGDGFKIPIFSLVFRFVIPFLLALFVGTSALVVPDYMTKSRVIDASSYNTTGQMMERPEIKRQPLESRAPAEPLESMEDAYQENRRSNEAAKEAFNNL